MNTASLIYADSDHCADMRYGTGLSVPDPFLYADVRGRKLVIVSPLEIGRARRDARRGVEVFSYEQARVEFGLKNLRALKQITGLSKHFHVRRWRVPRDFPLGMAEALGRRGIKVRSASGAFFPEREHKSAREIRAIIDAQRAAEAGMRAALTVLRQAEIRGRRIVFRKKTLTAEMLQAVIGNAVAERGANAANTIVASGAQGADAHERGTGPLLPHHPIVIDIFPRSNGTGYFGDLTRTVVKGRAAPVVKRAFRAVRTARDAATAMVRAGVNGKDVHQRVCDILGGAGFVTDMHANPPTGFIHGTGHGVGLEIHEAPRVSSADHALESGHVVTIEPGLYDPAWGGMRLEDIVMVRKRDCRLLTGIPTTLEIR